eukprot:g13032.t1
MTAKLARSRVSSREEDVEEKEEDGSGDENTGGGRRDPPPYGELSPHFNVLKAAAEESGNRDAAFHLTKAKMAMIAAHAAEGARRAAEAAAGPMTAEDSLPHDRRFELMWALQTLDPASLDSSLGFRRGVVAKLMAQSESCRRLGWTGQFVALQVDSTGMAGLGGGGDEEVCTASISLVPEDFGGLVRLAIGARCFRRGEESHAAKEAWIRKLASDLFSWIRGDPVPKDIYLAATVGGRCGGGGDGGNSFRRALETMGVPVLVCSSYRLHAVVACSLGADSGIGGGGGGGHGGGSPKEACANGKKMRRVVRKAAFMVERFERWRPAGGVYAAAVAHAAYPTTLASVRVEMEELGVALARALSSNARWTDSHALFERLLQLAGPIDAYFPANPRHQERRRTQRRRCRSAAAAAAGAGVGAAARREGAAADAALIAPAGGGGKGSLCSKRVENLTPEAQALLGAVAQEMEETGLARAREETEAVAMLLDPRFKQCRASTCVDGGNALKLRAFTTVSSQLRKFKGAAEAAGAGYGAAPHAQQQQDGGGGVDVVSRLEKMRQAQKMEAVAAATGGGMGGEGGNDNGGGSRSGGSIRRRRRGAPCGRRRARRARRVHAGAHGEAARAAAVKEAQLH